MDGKQLDNLTVVLAQTAFMSPEPLKLIMHLLCRVILCYTRSGLTTRGEVTQLPQGVKGQRAPLNSIKIIYTICCSISINGIPPKELSFSQNLFAGHDSSSGSWFGKTVDFLQINSATYAYESKLCSFTFTFFISNCKK